MKFVIQFLIVIGFSFLGEFLHYIIPLPIHLRNSPPVRCP